jgi:predicted nucleic acid-binding protein
LGLKAVAKKCDAMDYLKRLKELSKKLKLDVRDAAMISTAQSRAL